MAASPSTRSTLIPAAALLFLAFIVIFFALRAAFPPTALTTPTITPTVTHTVTLTRTSTVTVTPTTTPTVTITPRPTWTLRPSYTVTATGTPTVTNTPTLLSTIKPATPYKYNDLYELKPWFDEDADAIVAQLMSYPDSLYPKPEDRLSAGYNAAFFYAAFYQREALMRFPTSYAATRWKWGLAYSLTRTGDDRAADLYAQFILEAVASGQVNPDTLPAWFHQREPKLTLAAYLLATRPGYLDRRVIEIETTGGGIYLSLAQTPDRVQVVPLASLLDFTHAIETGVLIGDLTGDGVEEAVLYHTPGVNNFQLTTPRIFSLTDPPVELAVAQDLPLDLGIEYSQEFVIEDDALRMTDAVYPACPVMITRRFTWQGEQFDSDPLEYEIVPPEGEEGYCETIVDHAALIWGPERVIPMMEALLPVWPPNHTPEGKPYPADALDEWRYRLGLYHALAGDQTTAVDYLSEIVASPAAPDSQWIAPAQQFLSVYQSAEDVYTACLAESLCNPRFALERLAILSETDDPSLALDFVQRNGVSTRVSGYFDFDNDGSDERWLTVRHRSQDKLEFWALARGAGGVRALYLDFVEVDLPAPYYHEPVETPPIVQFEQNKGFVLRYAPDTGEPYLTQVTVAFIPTAYTGTQSALETATQILFSGGDPTLARDLLIEAGKQPRFVEVCRAYRICDYYYYTLGLSYELTGEDGSAINAYLNAWWENTRGPFALMARSRLLQKQPRPTFTRTPTITRTVTITPTITNTPDPNATATSTRTSTHTPDPNATPTDTDEPTDEATETDES